MIGANVAGWTVTAAIAENGNLRRYAVQHADGRTGVIEIAAAGTPEAAALADRGRGLAPGAAFDGGVDPYGNTFLVTPPQAAPTLPQQQPAMPAPHDPFAAPVAPPPPQQQMHPQQPQQPQQQMHPQQPMRQQPHMPQAAVPRIPEAPTSKRTQLIVGGVVVAVIAIVAIVAIAGGGPDRPPAPPLTVQATATWRVQCNGGLRFEVRTARDAVVEILGQRMSVDSRGIAESEFAREAVGERTTVTVRAIREGSDDAESEVAIPARPAVAPLAGGQIMADGIYDDAEARIQVGDGEEETVKVRHSYGRDGVPDGHVFVIFGACNLTPGTTEKEGVKAIVEAEQVRFDVDVAQLLWNTPGAKEPEKLTFNAKLKSEDTDPVAVSVTMKTPRVIGKYGHLAKIAEQPLVDAPAPGESGKEPVVAVENGNLSRTYLGGHAPVDAPYVAVFSSENKRAGSCGPYSDGLSRSYAKRYRDVVDCAVYEARTGKLVAKRRFSGRTPSCPYSVSTYSGKASGVYGSRPTEQIKKWIEKVTR